jgi:hypothetical protein
MSNIFIGPFPAGPWKTAVPIACRFRAAGDNQPLAALAVVN